VLRVGGARIRGCYLPLMSDHVKCERRIAELEAENAALRERIENQIRIRDVGKVARARLFQQERDRGASGSEIARAYGYKSGPYVMNRIRILDHGSRAVIDAWDRGAINDTKAELLARARRAHEEQDARLRAHLSTGRRASASGR